MSWIIAATKRTYIIVDSIVNSVIVTLCMNVTDIQDFIVTLHRSDSETCDRCGRPRLIAELMNTNFIYVTPKKS